MDVRIRVEFRGDARGDGIKLNARAPRAGIQTFRHQSKEVADAHRRFEDVRAGLEAEPLHGLPHCLNDFGRRVVRVRSRGASRRILLRAQQILQFVRDALPFPRRMWRKRIGHRAPTGVLHEDRLFLWRSRAVFRLDCFQRADGGEVGLSFLLQAALADAVGAGYAEIAGKGWCGSRVAGSNDSWG